MPRIVCIIAALLLAGLIVGAVLEWWSKRPKGRGWNIW